MRYKWVQGLINAELYKLALSVQITVPNNESCLGGTTSLEYSVHNFERVGKTTSK